MEKSDRALSGFVVGIDAANLRQGGGITHLIELVANGDPAEHGITRVVVWGGAKTLASLPHRSWLEKLNPPDLDGGLLRRTLWQRTQLSNAARKSQCDVLFVPGGSYAGDFTPVVTMSRNLLPFEWLELRRYGWSFTTLRLLALRYTQSRSFRGADGVIFLTEYARKAVSGIVGRGMKRTATIPHGLSSRFQSKPKVQQSISKYSGSNPFRILYVSIVDEYKHQWNLVEAVHALRQEGFPLALDLVGPAYRPAMDRLNAVISRLDPDAAWVHYRGAVPYEELHRIYTQADLGVFASSCENMPNILLETMAAGLPVACSNRGPMPEVLGDAGLFFDPENPAEIAHAIREFVLSPELRREKAKASFDRSAQFSWERCAEQTFSFLVSIIEGRQE